MGDIVEAHLRDRHQHGVYTLWIRCGDLVAAPELFLPFGGPLAVAGVTASLSPGQANNLAVLLDALDGVVLSDTERASLAWLAGFEAHTVGEHCQGDHPRPADPVADMPDLPTNGDLVEGGPRPTVSLRSASTFPQVGCLSTQPVQTATPKRATATRRATTRRRSPSGAA
jgi:hypothetical protein